MIDFSSRQLRAFLLVAEHHSFTRAASALFITPSGLSVMIKELEGQLGFRLFDRTTRQVHQLAPRDGRTHLAREGDQAHCTHGACGSPLGWSSAGQ